MAYLAKQFKGQPTKVLTGKVRFSYCHVFEPYAANGSNKEKYSVSILIDKNDKDTLSAIHAAVEAAKQDGLSKKFGGKIPKNFKTPLRDGDEEKEDDENYQGMMFINANSNNAPGVVSMKKDDFGDLEVMTEENFYSGCYGRATINFYAFNHEGKKGIAAGLGNLQKIEDGDRLSGGGASAAADFGEDDDE